MNKHFIAFLTMMSCLMSVAAIAAPGEYWEITTKMEMPGMPFAMPPTTQKVCIAKGGQNDPAKTSGDKACKMTDVKTVGNKTTWKARCDHNGEVTTGSGEQTSTANDYHGKLKLAGRDMNMTMAYSGKRIGGSCDSEEQGKKMKAQIKRQVDQSCDPSHYRSTAEWIQSADIYLSPQQICRELRDQFCEAVRRDVPRNAEAYSALIMHDQQMHTGVSIARECKLNMAATTKSVCRTLNGDNYKDLSAHCPAEAKKYREVQRRKDCEGRSYTAETRAADLKRCLSGKDDAGDDNDSAPESGSSSSKVRDGTRKLKGIFGF